MPKANVYANGEIIGSLDYDGTQWRAYDANDKQLATQYGGAAFNERHDAEMAIRNYAQRQTLNESR